MAELHKIPIVPTEEKLGKLFKPGDLIKAGAMSTGIVEAVFTSQTCDVVIYTVRWAKNVLQPYALETIWHSSLLEPATEEELLADATRKLAKLRKRVNGYAADFVSAIASSE